MHLLLILQHPFRLNFRRASSVRKWVLVLLSLLELLVPLRVLIVTFDDVMDQLIGELISIKPSNLLRRGLLRILLPLSLLNISSGVSARLLSILGLLGSILIMR